MANSISFKADEDLILKIIDFYSYCQSKISNDNYRFRALNENFCVIVYKTGTVLFQGVNAEIEAKLWHEIDQQEQLSLFNDSKEDDHIDHVGSDEVGCGDYFGPIVVVSSLVRAKNYDFLVNLGVKDSKQLNDQKIMAIAPEIIKHIPCVISVLTNEKYNDVRNKNYNLNKIKAYMHNFVLYKIVHTYNFKGKIVVDQFCEEKLFYSYLLDYKTQNIQRNIYFTTKAENKYIAVACASIVARYTFLNKMMEMEKEFGCKIPLGAGDEVDKFACKMIKEKGIKFVSKYVKLHYKNTEKIKELVKNAK